MPTYTYQCMRCGHTFDCFHSISANPRIVCVKCKGKCERLIGNGAGIIFKGSGFYETDYKRKGNNGVGEKHNSTNAGGNGKSSTSESKSPSTKEATAKS